jgi:RNA polymerase sigma-70 factor (ECF subfamily)
MVHLKFKKSSRMDPKSEELLLKAARKGDEKSFMLLFENHQKTVFQFAYRMVGSETVAQDLAQECFLSLLQSRVHFNGDRASMKTYLYGMVRNMARRHFRRSRMEISLDDCDEPPAPMIGEENVLQQEISATVQRAIARLPLLQREALLLFEYEDLSLDEIARILEIDAGTVKSRLYRARENLRRMLASYSNAEERG